MAAIAYSLPSPLSSDAVWIRVFIPLVRCYPICGDCLLRSREIKLPGAHHFVQPVFQPILDVRVPGDVIGLRPQISDAI